MFFVNNRYYEFLLSDHFFFIITLLFCEAFSAKEKVVDTFLSNNEMKDFEKVTSIVGSKIWSFVHVVTTCSNSNISFHYENCVSWRNAMTMNLSLLRTYRETKWRVAMKLRRCKAENQTLLRLRYPLLDVTLRFVMFSTVMTCATMSHHILTWPVKLSPSVHDRLHSNITCLPPLHAAV